MTEQRFWSKVNKTDICWLWTGSYTHNGYGQYSVNGENIRAHRYSYEIHNGEIPEGLLVRHTCDVRNCVNPNHLIIGTPQDNTQDMIERGRSKLKIGGGGRGEKNGYSKLKEDDVREIRIFKMFGFTRQELSNMYNVTKSCIKDVISRKSWSHI